MRRPRTRCRCTRRPHCAQTQLRWRTGARSRSGTLCRRSVDRVSLWSGPTRTACAHDASTPQTPGRTPCSRRPIGSSTPVQGGTRLSREDSHHHHHRHHHHRRHHRHQYQKLPRHCQFPVCGRGGLPSRTAQCRRGCLLWQASGAWAGQGWPAGWHWGPWASGITRSTVPTAAGRTHTPWSPPPSPIAASRPRD